MPYRSIATFQANPGEGDTFEAAYRRGAFLERAVTNPGFVRGELLRDVADPDRFVAIAEWDSEADYAAWQAAYDTLPPEPAETMLATLAEPPSSIVGEIRSTADRDTEVPQ